MNLNFFKKKNSALKIQSFEERISESLSIFTKVINDLKIVKEEIIETKNKNLETIVKIQDKNKILDENVVKIDYRLETFEKLV